MLDFLWSVSREGLHQWNDHRSQRFDLAGITIYHMTSKKGDVSSEKGEFSLRMGEGDSLFISALQFKELRLRIDRKTINSGRLDVRVVEGISELPEIVIERHSLTGAMEQDIKILW